MKRKVHLKVESNSSRVPEMSHKIFTPHAGYKILKILSPTDRVTRICKWGSGYLQPYNSQNKNDHAHRPIVCLFTEQVTVKSFGYHFRFKHMLLRTNAESAAFYRSGEIEKFYTDQRLHRLLKTQHSLILRQYPLNCESIPPSSPLGN